MARGLRLSEDQIQRELKELETRLATIDLDSVVEESAKETAAELTQVVRDAVAAHPEISSPANLNSEYYQGSPATSAHPPLTQRRAWEVTQVGNDFRVSPVPNVRRKAMLMELVEVRSRLVLIIQCAFGLMECQSLPITLMLLSQSDTGGLLFERFAQTAHFQTTCRKNLKKSSEKRGSDNGCTC